MLDVDPRWTASQSCTHCTGAAVRIAAMAAGVGWSGKAAMAWRRLPGIQTEQVNPHKEYIASEHRNPLS